MNSALFGVQTISIFFALFMLYVSWIHFKKGNIENKEFTLWFAIWIVFIYFALFPRTLDPVLSQLFVTRAMDLLMIVAFMILAYLGFQNHVGIKSVQKQVRILVRHQALKKANRKK